MWPCKMIKVNIFLSIVFSNISFFQEQNHVAHLYKTTGKTVFLSLETADTAFGGKCKLLWLTVKLLLECYGVVHHMHSHGMMA
jgi:hypothetical protein